MCLAKIENYDHFKENPQCWDILAAEIDTDLTEQDLTTTNLIN